MIAPHIRRRSPRKRLINALSRRKPGAAGDKLADESRGSASPRRRAGAITRSRAELARRIALARESVNTPSPRPHWRLFVGEMVWLAEPVKRPFRKLVIPPATEPQIVMVMPGFATHPVRMRYLARNLEAAGHVVKRWGAGVNLGPNEDTLERVESRLLELHKRYGRKVVLVGWSLGGLFAREMAWRHPEAVARVITMGSPFSGDMRANNVWRVYQFVAGHSVDNPPIPPRYQEKPPVDTIALWSPRDGIVSRRSASGYRSQRDKAIALGCTHMGFAYDREVVLTLLREIDGADHSSAGSDLHSL